MAGTEYHPEKGVAKNLRKQALSCIFRFQDAGFTRPNDGSRIIPSAWAYKPLQKGRMSKERVRARFARSWPGPNLESPRRRIGIKLAVVRSASPISRSRWKTGPFLFSAKTGTLPP